MNSFKNYTLKTELLDALDSLGFSTPTEIQAKAIPTLLEQKTIDLHGQAQTGTGKTLAFGIPLLERIDQSVKKPQALVVAPTRELVVQIFQSLQPLAKACNIRLADVYGGVSIERQFNDLKRGAQVIVGTPGRLNDHLRRKSLKLDSISTIVLDEADIMLDMGFKQEMDEILSFAPANRNIWLFSATVKPGIQDLMKSHMSNPVSVRVSKQQVASTNTTQYYCVVPNRYRLEALCRFIEQAESFYGFVFCRTKLQASELTEKLVAHGLKANSLHGDMSQVNRNRVIKGFKNKEFSVLVATDVAARGIDVQDISHVINYTMPEDQESYIHRIGRTGRAGKEGTAITLISSRDQRKMKELTWRFKLTINQIEVPSAESMIKAKLKTVKGFLDERITQSAENKVKELKTLTDSFSQEQTAALLLNLLEEKFFKPILEQKTIQHDEPEAGRSRRGRERRPRNGSHTELQINVGSDDGVNKKMMLDWLTKKGRINPSHVAKIRVIKRRTYVELPPKCAKDAMLNLGHQKVRGRRVRVTPVS